MIKDEEYGLSLFAIAIIVLISTIMTSHVESVALAEVFTGIMFLLLFALNVPVFSSIYINSVEINSEMKKIYDKKKLERDFKNSEIKDLKKRISFHQDIGHIGSTSFNIQKDK